MKASILLKQNIRALLHARHEGQHALAMWVGHTDAWLSKALNDNDERGIRMRDLDRIADFFGIATYQLFQPGITPVTERRSGRDRRKGKDRRISHQQREMMQLAAAIAPARRAAPASRRRAVGGSDE